MKTAHEMQNAIGEMYFLIARADPTINDLAGAAKQVACLIESDFPEIAESVCSGMTGWSVPLFP